MRSRISLRTILVLTTLIGAFVIFYIQFRSHYCKEPFAIDEIEKNGGIVVLRDMDETLSPMDKLAAWAFGKNVNQHAWVIGFKDSELTEVDGRRLAGLSRFHNLQLKRCKCTGEFFKQLGESRSIETLAIEANQLTKSESAVASLSSLKLLAVYEQRKSYSFLVGLPGVTERTKLRPSDLPKNLTSLFVHSDGIDSEWVKELSTNGSIKELAICSQQILPDDYKTLLSMPRLEKLWVYYQGGYWPEQHAMIAFKSEIAKINPTVSIEFPGPNHLLMSLSAKPRIENDDPFSDFPCCVPCSGYHDMLLDIDLLKSLVTE